VDHHQERRGLAVNVYHVYRGAGALAAAAGLTAAVVAGVQAPAAAGPAALAAPGVFVWGNNNEGQLADGTHTNRFTPVPVHGLPAGVRQVSVDDGSGLALLADGTVSAWGLNNFGQLGNNSLTDRPFPGPVLGLTGVTQVSAGMFHALALKNDGTVWAWGSDVTGELGDGVPSTFGALPQQVPGLTGIVQVAAGGFDSMALRNDGTVWAWGANDHFQLGNNGTQSRAVPGTVPFLAGITQIANGGQTGLALGGTNGNVWAWGRNDQGQAGVGTTTDVHLPTFIQSTVGVTQVAAGGSHSLAVVGTDHTLIAWGDNHRGALGDGTTTSTTLPHRTSLNNVVKVAAGCCGESAAIRSDGSLWTWGDNSAGELGTGSTVPFSTSPQPVPTLVGVTSISIGFGFDAAVGQSTVATVPDVVGDDDLTAFDELGAAGFAVRELTFVDDNCNSIGRVNSQSPTGGAVAPVGSTVTIWVGELPSHPCP
jgi:alpha-tubulin suppressor-like RCC1 family protein